MESIFHPIVSTFGPDSAKCTPANLTAVKTNLWDWQGWIVLVDLFILFLTLFMNWVPIEFAMVGAVTMLTAFQIIALADAVAGFSNTGVLAVVCLFILAESLMSTGAVEYLFTKWLGTPKTLGKALMRMMIPTTFVAAWISSTAVVALSIPIIARWSHKIKRPPSQLMMVLCFAVHLGGTCTLVGTLTNLVISGLASTYYCKNMGIFTLTTVGLPTAICGLGFLLLLSPFVLPDQKEYDRRQNAYLYDIKPAPSLGQRFVGYVRRLTGRQASSLEDAGSNSTGMDDVTVVVGKAGDEQPQTIRGVKNFLFHARATAKFANLTLEAAGLRHLGEWYVVSVRRGNLLYTAVAPDFVILEDDIISFTGTSSDFVTFARSKGLAPLSVDDGNEIGDLLALTNNHNNNGGGGADPISRFTVQAIVRDGSALIGKTPKEVNFRSTYHASIVGINRSGDALQAPRLGQVPLRVGDVLVLVTSEDFRWSDEVVARDLKPRFDDTFTRAFESFNLKSQESSASLGSTSIGTSGALTKDYLVGMRVASNKKLAIIQTFDGVSLQESGLRTMPRIKVAGIERDGVTNRAVGADFVLRAGDVIWFVTERAGISALRRIPALEDVESSQVQRLNVPAQKRRLVEAVISLRSDLLYKTVKEARFRTNYGAVVIAINRHGSRLLSKIGDTVLEPGDVLVLDAGPDFIKRTRDDPNFLILSEMEASNPPRFDRFYITVFVAAAMIVLTAAIPTDLLLPALFAVGICLGTKVITRERAHAAIDWRIIITVASAFGLSTALTNTRVAAVIGKAITDAAISTGTGEMGVLAVVMIFTEILCALITAKAGALLMFPVAANAAARLGINPDRMLIALMLGSSDFTTPQGHQTNLMVMGPGGYVFKDYVKLGIPFEILLNIVQLLCLAFIDYWWVCLIFSFLFLGGAVAFDHFVIADRFHKASSYVVEDDDSEVGPVGQ